MEHRFFVPTPISLGPLVLEGPEAHHLQHVLRVRKGSEVVLFDGSGSEFPARIVDGGRNDVRLQVLARRDVNRELPAELVLGVALPKGDRQRWLVEKSTELGVTRLIPLVTACGVAQPTSKALERLRRSVIEASKQCGRNRLMRVEPAMPLIEYLAAAPVQAERLVAHPQGCAPADLVTSAPASGIYLAVGPEGGFTGKEVDAARLSGWTAVHLGTRILRVETAAVVLAALSACRMLDRSGECEWRVASGD